MFADERRTAILSMLEHESSVQVEQLARTFGVSKVTARADLEALEQAGKLRRTHGGAVSLSRQLTVSVQERRVNVHAKEKRAIAREALQLVENGDSLLLDSGTTMLEFVRCLSQKSDLTIITADLTIAEYVDRSLPMSDVILLGGLLRKAHRYTTGPLTLAALKTLCPDKAFVCPGSFITGRGLMTNHESMAQLKHELLQVARHTSVLMDASKVGARGLICFGTLQNVETIVMDNDPEGYVAAALAESGYATQLRLAGTEYK